MNSNYIYHYFAIKKRYLLQAFFSASSLKFFNPNAQIRLTITNKDKTNLDLELLNKFFDEIEVIDERNLHPYALKAVAIKQCKKRQFYIDTDTLFLKDLNLPELNDAIGCCIDPISIYKGIDVQRFNSGVLLIDKSRDFLELWANECIKNSLSMLRTKDRIKNKGYGDQFFLNQLSMRTKQKFFVISEKYNYREYYYRSIGITPLLQLNKIEILHRHNIKQVINEYLPNDYIKEIKENFLKLKELYFEE